MVCSLKYTFCLCLVVLMLTGGRAWAISSEFHGLMVDVVAQMSVATAEMPVNDSCSTSMWSRSKSLIRNELGTPSGATGGGAATA